MIYNESIGFMYKWKSHHINDSKYFIIHLFIYRPKLEIFFSFSKALSKHHFYFENTISNFKLLQMIFFPKQMHFEPFVKIISEPKHLLFLNKSFQKPKIFLYELKLSKI